MNDKPIVVEFLCDEDGDHTAALEDCSKEGSKEFNDPIEAEKFIESCTQVLNLDELYDVVPLDLIPAIDKREFVESLELH